MQNLEEEKLLNKLNKQMGRRKNVKEKGKSFIDPLFPNRRSWVVRVEIDLKLKTISRFEISVLSQ